jgi:hypothetical protein
MDGLPTWEIWAIVVTSVVIGSILVFVLSLVPALLIR